MSIELFEHNERAYTSALQMLNETGKAAIVHPTGTGKSFIAFKLCEDFPDKTVCWLSPSEYIFRTQLENLQTASGFTPRNVRFFTYARLMLMGESELEDIQPDYIVLDEFHRAGAEMWSRGVEKLLAAYPDVPILGLSATNIRYLDNRRDMAEELFNGNVASEITLGEAIVRGILNPPKYVLSVYSYQKDLEKYQKRVKSAKNKAVRDTAERYLEALRRALEHAEGLDEIFAKHMTDRTGKYIVFCAGKEHMDEMEEKVREWLYKIDSAPHIYSVYSDDPGAQQSFADFKADSDNTHLRLLFCIDALNEGIHIDDVSGVILLRPTVSPIVYKQQIGRALSASQKTDAVIFDVVMNIENLYSIDSVEEEMRVAINLYRTLGEGEQIVNENFRVFGELHDCRELFKKLNDTLTTSWDLMYSCAKKYYEQFGNLDVPKRYKTPEGYSLGTWLLTQRKVYRGEQFGVLGEDRIAKLNAIGMEWDSASDISWRRNFAEARAYYEIHGDLNIPVAYITDNFTFLGQWIANLRTYRKDGGHSRYLTPERIDALDRLGMVWSVSDYNWTRSYEAASRYYAEHGNIDVPTGYVTPDGIRLGTWLNNLRRARAGLNDYRLTQEQVRKLDELGMTWEGTYKLRWEAGFAKAREYFETHGDLNVPGTYRTESGFKLGDWISNQRESYRTGKLKADRVKRLEDMGMVWKKDDPWETRFALAQKFYELHGHLRVPANLNVNGVNLYKWINEQKQAYRGNRKQRLTDEQIRKLEGIGIEWERKTARMPDANAQIRQTMG